MFLSRLDSKHSWLKSLDTTPRAHTALINLDPGQFSPEESELEEGEDQLFLVLEGEVVADFGNERARIPAGHMLVIPAGVPHRFCNLGQGRARTMRVYANQGRSRMRW